MTNTKQTAAEWLTAHETLTRNKMVDVGVFLRYDHCVGLANTSSHVINITQAMVDERYQLLWPIDVRILSGGVALLGVHQQSAVWR